MEDLIPPLDPRFFVRGSPCRSTNFRGDFVSCLVETGQRSLSAGLCVRQCRGTGVNEGGDGCVRSSWVSGGGFARRFVMLLFRRCGGVLRGRGVLDGRFYLGPRSDKRRLVSR
ncbi:hypothetical protein TI83_04325 [Rathayibacter toxicus]|nr:hypothetical protein TI83_04325 [Rathayibacter toxicus]